jgi:hypothetical protein
VAVYIDRATLHPKGWNEKVNLPYGLRPSEIKAAIDDIYDFLHNVNRFLIERGWDRLEETLSAATFSGVMSELVVEGVSKRSATIIKNQCHNGRPDLIPRGMYGDDGCLRGADGIEVKASRLVERMARPQRRRRPDHDLSVLHRSTDGTYRRAVAVPSRSDDVRTTHGR